MNRAFFIAYCLLPVSALAADELCKAWERKIEPDMQMEESLFSEENAEDSGQFLEEVENNKITKYGWYEPGNAKKIIKGYKLKKAAIDSLKLSQNSKTPELAEFCEFIINEAFYYD